MAFDYTGFFTKSGKIIKYINTRLASATTTLPAELTAIADLYEADDMTQIVSSIYDQYESFQQSVVSERVTLATYIDRTLADRETILDELLIIDGSPDTVLPALHKKMISDSQTIDRSTVTIGTVTADAANAGNGTILISKVLDGRTPPLSGGISIPEYSGQNSELSCSETMTFTCVADSGTSGAAEGGESFSWRGEVDGGLLGWYEGSGDGPSLTVSSGANILTNGDFENFTSDAPDSWDIDNGDAATDIVEETSTVHRGDSALKFVGDGSQATIGISQTITGMQAGTMYLLSARIKASGTPAAGNIVIRFAGTGYTAASSEKIDIAAGSFPTAAFSNASSLKTAWIVTPNIIPSDWELVIEITGTLSNGTTVIFDSVAVTQATYHNGVGAVAVPGTIPFELGDTFTCAITNNGAGIFQEFFRKYYKVQMPSDGSPTINDSLAQ